MLVPPWLFSWLLELESNDREPQRRNALLNGYEVARLAVTDGHVTGDETGHGQLAMALGQLHSDGWLEFDWLVWPNDPGPPTSGRMYQAKHLQRMENLRLTPRGITAHVARGAVRSPPAEPHVDHAYDAAAASELRDAFISHASEDKESVARPLTHALEARGHSVWFDEAELVVGSSLSEAIDEGLATSRFGVVVLSHRFFAKNWPRRELQGLVAKEMTGGERVILPIWHGLSHEDVAGYSLPLADLLAADMSQGIDAVADQISRAIARRRRLESARGHPMPARGGTGTVAAEELSFGEDLVEVRDRLVGLIRAEDDVGIREMLRAERRHFESQLLEAMVSAGDTMDREVDVDRLRALEAGQWALVQRRAATLLPLVEYARDSVREELAEIAALSGRQVPTRSSLEMWRRATRPAVWMLVHLIGAHAVAEHRWSVVRLLWETQTHDGRPLGVLRLQPAERLAAELAKARPNTYISSREVALWHLAFSMASSDFLLERYRELVSVDGVDDPVTAVLSRVGDFSWLMTALAASARLDVDQWWRANQVKPTLPDRLNADPGLVAALTGPVFGHDSWTLPGNVAEWVSGAREPS
jgi:hypothetical protein